VRIDIAVTARYDRLSWPRVWPGIGLVMIVAGPANDDASLEVVMMGAFRRQQVESVA
jgi:hypothetical protein